MPACSKHLPNHQFLGSMLNFRGIFFVGPSAKVGRFGKEASHVSGIGSVGERYVFWFRCHQTWHSGVFLVIKYDVFISSPVWGFLQDSSVARVPVLFKMRYRQDKSHLSMATDLQPWLVLKLRLYANANVYWHVPTNVGNEGHESQLELLLLLLLLLDFNLQLERVSPSSSQLYTWML